MLPANTGVTLHGLDPAGELSGSEEIEISMPVTLANSQVIHKSFKTTLNDLLRLYNVPVVTAESLGVYTIAQVEDLLRQKLGVADIAVNALRLDGATKQEIIDEARSGTSANAAQLGGQNPEFYAKDGDLNELVDTLTQSFISASVF